MDDRAAAARRHRQRDRSGALAGLRALLARGVRPPAPLVPAGAARASGRVHRRANVASTRVCSIGATFARQRPPAPGGPAPRSGRRGRLQELSGCGPDSEVNSGTLEVIHVIQPTAWAFSRQVPSAAAERSVTGGSPGRCGSGRSHDARCRSSSATNVWSAGMGRASDAAVCGQGPRSCFPPQAIFASAPRVGAWASVARPSGAERSTR